MIELESLECEYCGKVYDSTDYVDVYKKNNGSFICERCLESDEM
jgi:hypothetical protein